MNSQSISLIHAVHGPSAFFMSRFRTKRARFGHCAARRRRYPRIEMNRE
jgi:hypothetical protein